MSTTYEIKIDGMSCGHCVKAVETALGAMNSVSKADVEIGKAVITVSEDIDTASIEEAIDNEGYSVQAIQPV